MNPTNPWQQEAIERAEVITSGHPSTIVQAVQERVAAHAGQYLLQRLEVRPVPQGYDLTIHGQVYASHAPATPSLRIERFTITEPDEASVPAAP